MRKFQKTVDGLKLAGNLVALMSEQTSDCYNPKPFIERMKLNFYELEKLHAEADNRPADFDVSLFFKQYDRMMLEVIEAELNSAAYFGMTFQP